MNEVKIIDNRAIADSLVETISCMEYGDIITHEEIESIIGFDRESNKYRTLVTKTKKQLKCTGKHLVSVRGIGYKISEPDKVVDVALSHYKKGFNEVKKGQEILDHAPVNDMSTEGRIAYRRVYDRAVILDAAMKGAAVELKELAGKRPHPFLAAYQKK